MKIVVPFPAGGTADAVPRLVADWLSRKWGQPVVIDNRTGAAGNIGAEAAYRSAPDGYTLLSAPPPPLVINQNLYPKLGFDPTQFEPIIVIAHVPNALMVNPDKVKASSVTELIEYLQKNPGEVTAATQGNGKQSDGWSVYGQPPRGNVCNCPAVMGDPFPTWPSRWEEVPKIAYDPAERLKALDIDRVDAEVLFPNPPGGSFYEFGDVDFELDVVQAYNDSLADWRRVSDRYLPLVILPFGSAESARLTNP